VNDRAVKVRKEPRRILEGIRRILAAAIGRETEKNYVVRPWTDEEDAEFKHFSDSIDANPIEPGFDPDSVEILTIDPWHDVELPRA